MNKFKRMPAALVIICLLAVYFAPVTYGASAIGVTLYENTVKTSEHTSFYDLTAGIDGNAREQFYAVEYTPNNKIVPIVAYGSKLYGRSTITSVAETVRKSGDRVMFGVNADFFSLETGIPMGIVINKGRLVSSDAGYPAVGFYEDGRAVIGYPNLKTTITTPSGEVVDVTHINKKRTVFGTYLLTSDFSANTRNETAGYDVFLRYSDALELKVGMTGHYIVDRIQENTGAVDIPEGYLVVTIDKNGPYTEVLKFHVGETVTLNIECGNNAFSDVFYACGAGSVLLDNGQAAVDNSSLSTTKNPRTALGIKQDGSIVFLTVDGRQSGYSAGLSLKDFTAQLKSMGCVTAVNLDGGGSTSFVIQYPGDSALTLVNSPSDGSLRKCANFIFLVNRTAMTNQPKYYYIYPLENKVLLGSTIGFDIKATDENFNAAFPSDKITTYITNDNSFDPANQKAVINDDGSVTFPKLGPVQYNVYDQTSVFSKTLEVIDKIDEIGLYKQGAKTPLTSLNVGTGESIPLDIKALVNTREVLSNLDAFTISVDATVGSIDEKGVFTSSEIMGSSGYITVSCGDCQAKVKVTVGRPPELLEDFEGDPNHWDILLPETRPYGHIETNTDLNTVKFGLMSAKIIYDYQTAEPDNQMTFVMPQNQIAVREGEKYISMWVYGDGSKNSFTANFTNQNGTALNQTLIESIDFTGWKFVTAPLPADSGLKLRGLMLTHSAQGALTGSIYIDQIITSQSTPLYHGVPDIKLNEPVLNITTGLMEVKGTALDKNGAPLKRARLSVQIDGQSTEYTYDESTGAVDISFQPDQLGAGLHKITAEGSDALGNTARKNTEFLMASTDQKEAFPDIKGHWSQKYVEYIAGKGIIAGVSVNNVLQYQPERSVTRAEFCVIMSRFLGLNPDDYKDAELPFADRESLPSWAAPYIAAMYENSLISGRAAGDSLVFDPEASLTRAECATIMAKTLQKGYGESDQSFADASTIPDWAKEGIGALVQIEVLSGYLDGTVRPNQSIRRSEIAKMIYMLY